MKTKEKFPLTFKTKLRYCFKMSKIVSKRPITHLQGVSKCPKLFQNVQSRVSQVFQNVQNCFKMSNCA